MARIKKERFVPMRAQKLKSFSEKNEEQLIKELFETSARNEDEEESPTYEPTED